MLQIRTVLIPTDRSSGAKRAYAPAAALAALHGAALRMVHVDEGRHSGNVRTAAADEAHDIEEIAASHASPALDILDHARAHDADLIVIGTHGRLGTGHFLLGRVTEQVVRLAHRPVLTVPYDALHDGGPIVVGVDFSEGSRVALLHAQELAAASGAALHVLHVAEWPADPLPSLVGLPVLSEDDVIACAHAELDAFAAGADVVVVVRARAGGMAALSVAEYARDAGASLVVVSTQGRTGLGRLLMGSVAERVVRSAPCPVLTVHPGGWSLLPHAAAGAAAATGGDGAAALPSER